VLKQIETKAVLINVQRKPLSPYPDVKPPPPVKPPDLQSPPPLPKKPPDRHVATSTTRTSRVITIGLSPRHRGGTVSNIMFGKRAIQVENVIKLKEEFDYKSLSGRLEIGLDKLIMEHERQLKAFEDKIERLATEAQHQISEAKKKLCRFIG
jgi:hypothetical protein